MSRHPSIEEKLEYFNFNHLPTDMQGPSRIISQTVTEILNEIPVDSPQLALGLQKLIEAKDCFVRAKIKDLDRP